MYFCNSKTSAFVLVKQAAAQAPAIASACWSLESLVCGGVSRSGGREANASVSHATSPPTSSRSSSPSHLSSSSPVSSLDIYIPKVSYISRYFSSAMFQLSLPPSSSSSPLPFTSTLSQCCLNTSAYVSIRQRQQTSANVSIRQHTSARRRRGPADRPERST